MIRGCTLLFLLLGASVASAQAEPDLASTLAQARALDARTEHRTAAGLYEAYALACIAHRTAVLETCDQIAEALGRAFELARALGDEPAAERIGAAYVEHLLYARPREATQIGYQLARLQLEAGRPEAAEAALERWIELSADAPDQAILVEAMRARIALAAGRRDRANRHWRQLERRFERARESLDESSRELVVEGVAEARLLRAEAHVERFLETSAPPPPRGRSDRTWWSDVITPWRVRAERRLLLARMELERVYELGSPRHSVAAAARIGELYEHLAALHASMAPPRDEWIRVLLTRGEDRPGYDEAIVHFETCIRWADHHEVARRWAGHCEARLHALDPERYPRAAELAGQAAYVPAGLAAPPPVR